MPKTAPPRARTLMLPPNPDQKLYMCVENEFSPAFTPMKSRNQWKASCTSTKARGRFPPAAQRLELLVVVHAQGVEDVVGNRDRELLLAQLGLGVGTAPVVEGDDAAVVVG